MSVLCTYPPKYEDERLDFTLFESILKDIDSLLSKGGFLVIYNANYRFTDSEVSKKYEVVDTLYKESKHTSKIYGKTLNYDGSGFVPKYDKDGNSIDEYPYYMFRKIR